MTSDEIARIFSEFGDLNVYKDSHSSFFIEFYFIEASAVPTQTIPDFIKIVFAKEAGAYVKRHGIRNVVSYQDAIKFKAHNRLEWHTTFPFKGFESDHWASLNPLESWKDKEGRDVRFIKDALLLKRGGEAKNRP